jgi:hypothetical protein
MYTTTNRYEALQDWEDEESEESINEIRIEDMEIDEEPQAAQDHPTSSRISTKTNKPDYVNSTKEK